MAVYKNGVEQGGATAADIWAYATRTITALTGQPRTDLMGENAGFEAGVGARKARIDAAITSRSSHAAADIWAVATRALTDKAGFTISGAKTTLDALNDIAAAAVWAVATRLLTRPVGIIPGDAVLLTNATEREHNTGIYTNKKEIMLGLGGLSGCKIRTYFEIHCQSALGTSYGKVYKTTVAVGTERSTSSVAYVSFAEDLVFAAGDLYQIYVKTDDTYNVFVQNQGVRGIEGIGVATSGY